jgi:hypothetical protein
MVTKHVFWGKYFGKSDFGHFFCPISTFPKYFPSKKQSPLLQPVDKKFSRKLQNPLHNVVNCAPLKGTYRQFYLKSRHHKPSYQMVYMTL